MYLQMKWLKAPLLSCSWALMLSATAVYGVDGIVSLTQEDLEKKAQALQAKEPVYVDQLIAGETEEDVAPEDLLIVTEVTEPEGVRSWQIVAGFRALRDAQGGHEQRHELGFSGSLQTYAWGDVSMRAQLNHRDSEYEPAKRQGGHFTVDQRNAAVQDGWNLDNTFGVNQLTHGKVTASSSQVSLPSRAFAGLSSRLHKKDTELRLMVGEAGDLNDVSDFERTGDQLAGVGLSHRLPDEGWDFGAQLWQTLREDEVKVREATVAARYQDEAGNMSIKTQALATDNDYGVWLDAKYKKERFRHQAGFFQLGESLTWVGKPIDSDSRGAYWRMSYTHPKYYGYTSLDWNRRTQQEHAGFRQSLSYHWDRDTQTGGDVSFSWDKHNTPGVQDAVKRTRVTAFIANDYAAHSNRLQGSVAYSSSVLSNKEQVYELDYSHRWQGELGTLGTQLNVAQRHLAAETEDDAITRTLRAGVSWQRELTSETNVSMKVDWLQSRVDRGDHATATGYRLLLDHRLSKQWQLEASLEHNMDNAADAESVGVNTPVVPDATTEATTQDTALYFALRYQDTKGTPLNAAGRRSGKIRGVVFFDENNDGVMQPLEKPAANMTVRLVDSGLPVVTNRSGEFEFIQAPVGEHELSLAEENIPLPWGLADDARYTVTIALRQTRVINIPLVRLGTDD